MEPSTLKLPGFRFHSFSPACNPRCLARWTLPFPIRTNCNATECLRSTDARLADQRLRVVRHRCSQEAAARLRKCLTGHARCLSLTSRSAVSLTPRPRAFSSFERLAKHASGTFRCSADCGHRWEDDLKLIYCQVPFVDPACRRRWKRRMVWLPQSRPEG